LPVWTSTSHGAGGVSSACITMLTTPDAVYIIQQKIGPESWNRTTSYPASTGGATVTPTGDGGEPENRTLSRLTTRSCFRDRCQPFSTALQKWRKARESNSVLPLSDKAPFSRRLTAIGRRIPKICAAANRMGLVVPSGIYQNVVCMLTHSSLPRVQGAVLRSACA
jgi:hypothetical protein